VIKGKRGGLDCHSLRRTSGLTGCNAVPNSLGECLLRADSVYGVWLFPAGCCAASEVGFEPDADQFGLMGDHRSPMPFARLMSRPFP
jgi:hypothetical protein